MKKVIWLFTLVFLFSCTHESKRNPVQIDTPTAPALTTPIRSDSVKEQKVRDAFTLLQKYAGESKVLPKNFSKRYIIPLKRVIFGTVETNGDGSLYVQLEDGITAKPGDLVIFFEDAPSNSDHSARTFYTGMDKDSSYGITIVSAYVETKSIALIASVILHELVHVGLHAEGAFQTNQVGSMINNQNEYQAYSVQTKFLVYAYNGVEKEYEYVHPLPTTGTHTQINCDSLDGSDFLYFLGKRDELYSKIPH